MREGFVLPLKAVVSHTLMVIFTTDITEMKLFFFRTINQESSSAASVFFNCHVAYRLTLVINHNPHHPASKKQAFETEVRSWPLVFYNSPKCYTIYYCVTRTHETPPAGKNTNSRVLFFCFCQTPTVSAAQ